MKLKPLLCILLFIFVTGGAIAGQRRAKKSSTSKAVQKVRFASGNSALKIPFELFSNLVLVQLRVNNSQSLRFILDTGADTSVIDVQQANALHLKPHGKIVATGGAGTAEATFTRGVKVSIPGVDLSDQTIYVLSLEAPSAIGLKVDGVIGNDILKNFVVEIDYATKTINLYEAHAYQHAATGDVIPLMISEGLLFVRGSVVPEGGAPIEASFEIDSGSTGGVLLNTPFVDKHKLLLTVPKTIQANLGGLGGMAKTFIGRIKSLKLGGFVIDQPVTRFSRATQGDYASSQYDGLIGGEILRRFKVIVDYSRRQMTLEPNANFSEPYEVDMSGITLVIDGADFLIDEVEEHSAAAEAGVLGGDILISVDGRPATELGLDEIRTMFMQDGKEYLLSLRRAGKVVQLKLRLRRRI